MYKPKKRKPNLAKGGKPKKKTTASKAYASGSLGTSVGKKASGSSVSKRQAERNQTMSGYNPASKKPMTKKQKVAKRITRVVSQNRKG